MHSNTENNSPGAGSVSEQEDFDSQIEYVMDASFDNLPLPNIGSPLAFLALSQNPNSISFFRQQQVQQQMQIHMLLQQQQQQEIRPSKDESDFGPPSDIDIETEQSKFPAPLDSQNFQRDYSKKIPGAQDVFSSFSIPVSVLPQPNIMPLMYSYQQTGNLGNLAFERPDTALANYLEREEANDFEKKQSNVAKYHFSAMNSNSPYADFSKAGLGLPTKILSPFAPQYKFGFPVGDSMPFPLTSAGSSCSQNAFFFDTAKDNKQKPTTPKPQILTTDHGITAPMSSMGMMINPVFMTGSSTFSPMEFNYLPSNELLSTTGSWAENPFNPRYFNVPIPGMIAMSKKDTEAYELFKKTHKLSSNEYDEKSIHVTPSVESKEKQNSGHRTACKNNLQNEKNESDANAIKPQQLIFNDEKPNIQPQYHLLPLTGATNEPLNSIFLMDNDEAVLKVASPALPENVKNKKKQHTPRKTKPKSLNLNMGVSNIFDLDNVVVDYSDAILGASKKYESLHFANPFTPPTVNGNAFLSGDEHEIDASENNADYINLLVLREKAIELGLETGYTEGNNMEALPKTNSLEKNVTSKLQQKKKSCTVTEQSSQTIKPQYIEADFEFQESSIFTKSTKQVIDQIKHEALNNDSSKLVSFSPIHSSKEHLATDHNPSPLHTLTLISSNKNSNKISDLSCAELSQSTETSNRILPLTGEKMINSADYTNKSNGDFKKTTDTNDSVAAFEKKETFVNNNPVTKALQSTMNAILKNGLKKKKGPTKKSSKIQDKDHDPLKKTNKKVTKSSFPYNKGSSNLASNESIKSQYLSAFSGKQHHVNHALTFASEKSGLLLPNKDSNENKNINIGNPAFDEVNADDSTQLGDTFSSSLPTTTPRDTKALPLDINNMDDENDPNRIINKLEFIFKNKKTPQRKHLINISNQVLSSFGNLVVKSSDTKTETTKNNASLSWKTSMQGKKENVTNALLNDPNFTMEQLKKPKKGLFSCLHCTFKFSSILLYANHLDTIDFERPFKCPFNDCCWKYLGMTTTAKLKRHCALQHMPRLNAEMKKILSINKDSYPEMKCSHKSCDKVFMRKDSIVRHLQMVHDNTNSRFNQRQRKVMSLMKNNFSHLNESEQEVLIQQYMNGSLSLSSSNNPKPRKKSLDKTDTLNKK